MLFEETRYEINVHGYNVTEMIVLLNQLLTSLSDEYEELVVVHGYHQHVLMDYLRKEYKHPRVEAILLDMNPGVSILKLKKDYKKKKRKKR